MSSFTLLRVGGRLGRFPLCEVCSCVPGGPVGPPTSPRAGCYNYNPPTLILTATALPHSGPHDCPRLSQREARTLTDGT